MVDWDGAFPNPECKLLIVKEGSILDAVGEIEVDELFRTFKFLALQNWVPLVYSLTSEPRYAARG